MCQYLAQDLARASKRLDCMLWKQTRRYKRLVLGSFLHLKLILCHRRAVAIQLALESHLAVRPHFDDGFFDGKAQAMHGIKGIG